MAEEDQVPCGSRWRRPHGFIGVRARRQSGTGSSVSGRRRESSRAAVRWPRPGRYPHGGEGEERRGAALPHQHHEVPAFPFGADEERPAGGKEHEVAAGLVEEREGVADVAVEGLGTADGRVGREFGMGPESATCRKRIRFSMRTSPSRSRWMKARPASCVGSRWRMGSAMFMAVPFAKGDYLERCGKPEGQVQGFMSSGYCCEVVSRRQAGRPRTAHVSPPRSPAGHLRFLHGTVGRLLSCPPFLPGGGYPTGLVHQPPEGGRRSRRLGGQPLPVSGEEGHRRVTTPSFAVPGPSAGWPRGSRPPPARCRQVRVAGRRRRRCAPVCRRRRLRCREGPGRRRVRWRRRRRGSGRWSRRPPRL